MLSLLELWTVVLYPTPPCCMNSYLGTHLLPSPLWYYSLLNSSVDSLLQDGDAGCACLEATCNRFEASDQSFCALVPHLLPVRFLCRNIPGHRTANFIIHSDLDLICWVISVSSCSSPIVLALKCCHSMNIKAPAPDKWWRLDFLGCGLASAWSVELVSCINHLDVQHKVDGSEVFMMVCPSGKPA